MASRTSESAREVVAAPTELGWAIVDRPSWDHINDQLDAVAAVLSCTSWGAFRQLGLHDDGILELVYQESGVEPGSEPADDAPFSVDLTKYEEYDRDAWLQRATTDFIYGINDLSFPLPGVDTSDIWTTIDAEHVDELLERLKARGFSVTKIEG